MYRVEPNQFVDPKQDLMILIVASVVVCESASRVHRAVDHPVSQRYGRLSKGLLYRRQGVVG